MRGYSDGRTLCLTKGVEDARRQAVRRAEPAYEAGFDWALWDFEDANGLPHGERIKFGA